LGVGGWGLGLQKTYLLRVYQALQTETEASVRHSVVGIAQFVTIAIAEETRRRKRGAPHKGTHLDMGGVGGGMGGGVCVWGGGVCVYERERKREKMYV
jgi:hypothetical protein